MWYDESTFYQIYPLGLCGAPKENNGIEQNRISRIIDWIPHLQALSVGAVYFCPVFESDRHGYDTRDYSKIDCRLGSNDDFKEVCGALHYAGIRVVLDGVFNHVGRGFFAFQDVLRKRENSKYKHWFNIDFSGNSNYNDGLWYEGWEGHYELVKLNLQNGEVTGYLFDCIRGWVNEFSIDGIRLDVAYLLPEDFLRKLRCFTDSISVDLFLVGEAIHGDYNRITGDGLLHSCTNYECYKGLYSSFNDKNMYEIGYSLNRQFGPEQWTLYKGKHLFCFADNHDVSRIASRINQKSHLKVLYGLLYAMPGIPCLYYGSEWGLQGKKEEGDDSLRPEIALPESNELTAFLAQLNQIRSTSPALCYGDYKQLYINNAALVFAREYEGKPCVIAINIDESEHAASLPVPAGKLTNLLTGMSMNFAGQLVMPPRSCGYYVRAE